MSGRAANFDWDDAKIAKLTALWAEGVATSEIGRQLGVSKNAVVGKSSRLNLKPRPSPIRRAPEGAATTTTNRAPRRESPSPRTTLPPLPIPEPVAAPGPSIPEPTVTAAAPAERAADHVKIGAAPCSWPTGEPGTPGFRFCDDPTAAGRPYCPTHCTQAYVNFDKRPAPRITRNAGR